MAKYETIPVIAQKGPGKNDWLPWWKPKEDNHVSMKTEVHRRDIAAGSILKH